MQTVRLAISVIAFAVVVGAAASYFGLGATNASSGETFGNGPVVITE